MFVSWTLATREASLVNGCFFLLLVQTVLRWADPRIVDKQKQDRLSKVFQILGRSSAGFLRIALVLRWISSHHFPVSNLYESLVFLSFLLTVGLVRIEKTGAPKAALALAMACPVLILGFASFCLPEDLRAAGPLVPALKSNWLLMHVTVMILAYAGLLLGSLLAIVFLATNSVLKQTKSEPEQQSQVLLNRLDQASYRLITFGFPFLTLGILSGAVWANETWGSYWSWDPKETWSLITWLVFAAYLHTRLIRGFQGLVPAILASRGFVLVWVCYLGVNLLGKGLHSYGWFLQPLFARFFFQF